MTTTERPARRSRWPKGRIRALAWLSGAMAAVASAAAISPALTTTSERPVQARPRVIERHVIRRVIIVDPPTAAPVAPVTVVQAPAPAPAPPPPVTTGGS
jgi:hypothetical protein